MTKRNIAILTLIVLFVTSTAVAVPPPKDIDLDRVLDAIQKVETGGCKNPSKAVGDGGIATIVECLDCFISRRKNGVKP